MKLEEGRYYKFKPVKTITLPDSSESMVLHGPDGKKYLLALSPYKYYRLKDKKEVTCKVDKISCSGKVFLEPENPWYAPGDIVETTVENAEYDVTMEHYVVELCDNKGFLYTVRMSRKPQKQMLRCSVLKIRKGRPVLIPLDEE